MIKVRTKVERLQEESTEDLLKKREHLVETRKGIDAQLVLIDLELERRAVKESRVDMDKWGF